MFVDARTIPNGVLPEADPCVAGVGSAGIALTREFIGPDPRVLLLESGGTGPDLSPARKKTARSGDHEQHHRSVTPAASSFLRKTLALAKMASR